MTPRDYLHYKVKEFGYKHPTTDEEWFWLMSQYAEHCKAELIKGQMDEEDNKSHFQRIIGK